MLSNDDNASQLALIDSNRQQKLASKLDLSSIDNNNTISNREQTSPAGDDSVSESTNENPESAMNNIISVSSHSELVDLNGSLLFLFSYSATF